MSKKLLVATLGTSPAVITEAIDLLEEQQARPDGVILFMTHDPDVQNSYELLARHLPAHDGIARVEPVYIATYEDIADSHSAVDFLQEACRILKTYRDNGNRLLVSIAGGRKVMSALLALAVQFYGAERLFHIWVPPWLEEEGEIAKLRHLPEDDIARKLHPSLANMQPSDRPHLVDLPFIGLFPLLGDILNALKGETIPTRDLGQMLVANGLLTSQGELTSLGKNVSSILENVEDLPPARQTECRIHISPHHYQDELQRFAQRLCIRFPYVTEIQSDEWRQGTEVVKTEAPNVLIVGIRLRTDILFRLRLVTTAITTGQLEAARRDIKRYLRSQ